MDESGRIVLPAEALDALRPDGERLTVVDIEVGVEHESLILRRSTIDEEGRWAYTPEIVERHARAMNRSPDEDLHLSQRELERLAGLEPE